MKFEDLPFFDAKTIEDEDGERTSSDYYFEDDISIGNTKMERKLFFYKF